MVSRYVTSLVSAFAAITLALARPVVAQQVYVSTDGTNLFGVLDLALNKPSGPTFTPITLNSTPTDGAFLGMGYGTDGKIYAVDSTANYYQIDPAKGTMTTIGSPITTGDGSVLEAVSDNKGTMYVVDTSNDLYKVDMTQPYTHTATYLGTINLGNSNSTSPPLLDGYIALDSTNHLYVGATADFNANQNGHDALYLVTPNAAGGVDTTQVNNGAMDTGFDQLTGGVTINSKLYGFGGPMGNTSNIVTVDPTTGGGTIVSALPGTVDGAILASLLVSPTGVPEASSFMLLSLMFSTLGGGVLLHRKKASARG